MTEKEQDTAADCGIANPFICLPRIAVVEEKARATDAKIDKMVDGIESLKKSNAELKESNAAIRSDLARQRGFWAGVTFAVSIVAYFARDIWQRVVA
jgi:hypothetical protein